MCFVSKFFYVWQSSPIVCLIMFVNKCICSIIAVTCTKSNLISDHKKDKEELILKAISVYLA